MTTPEEHATECPECVRLPFGCSKYYELLPMVDEKDDPWAGLMAAEERERVYNEARERYLATGSEADLFALDVADREFWGFNSDRLVWEARQRLMVRLVEALRRRT